MPDTIHEHDPVALLVNLPEHHLVAGDVGTAVFVHNRGEAFEVEFVDPTGEDRYIVVTVNAEQLLKLRQLAPRRVAG